MVIGQALEIEFETHLLKILLFCPKTEKYSILSVLGDNRGVSNNMLIVRL